jgi:soluble lytic murein transglycosylase-like protein
MATPCSADLLVIKGGFTRSSNWTFHDERDGAATAVIAPTPSNSARPAILAAIQATATRHQNNRALASVGLTARDWQILFQAMIEAESAYNPTAQSPVGAYGLGQLMPATARDLGVDRNDMPQNLDGAARYLLAQLASFRDIDLALAAYNAGPHRVVEYQGIPPFVETHTYIARVNRIRTRLSTSPNPNASTRVAQDAPSDRPALVLTLN